MHHKISAAGIPFLQGREDVKLARPPYGDWQPGCQTRRHYAFSAAAMDFNTTRCRSSFKWAASI